MVTLWSFTLIPFIKNNHADNRKYKFLMIFSKCLLFDMHRIHIAWNKVDTLNTKSHQSLWNNTCNHAWQSVRVLLYFKQYCTALNQTSWTKLNTKVYPEWAWRANRVACLRYVSFGLHGAEDTWQMANGQSPFPSQLNYNIEYRSCDIIGHTGKSLLFLLWFNITNQSKITVISHWNLFILIGISQPIFNIFNWFSTIGLFF